MTNAATGPTASRRAADTRFLLPFTPSSVVVLGSRSDEEASWRACGIEVLPTSTTGPVDVVVTDSPSLGRALAIDARALIIHSKRRRRSPLATAGWQVQRYLELTGDHGPIIVASTTRQVLRYLAVEWSPPANTVEAIIRLGMRSPAATKVHNLTIATRERGLPQPLTAAAAAADVTAPDACFMFFGSGNDRQRPVAFAFAESAKDPDWLVKWSRSEAEPERGRREHQIRAAISRYPSLSGHISKDLGRLTIAGAPATVETVAPGISLDGLRARSGADQALAVGERVLAWLCDLSVESAVRSSDPEALIVDQAAALGVDPTGLLAAISDVPRVISHNDLGTVNVLTNGSRFTVIDWEDGLIEGLPIVDVVYFLTTLLATIHAPDDARERAQWCCALWRGDLPQSQIAFRWLRRSADALGLDNVQAGALVTLSWLHGAHSQRDRDHLQSVQTPTLGYARGFVPEYWVRDERLGLGWRFDAHPS